MRSVRLCWVSRIGPAGARTSCRDLPAGRSRVPLRGHIDLNTGGRVRTPKSFTICTIMTPDPPFQTTHREPPHDTPPTRPHHQTNQISPIRATDPNTPQPPWEQHLPPTHSTPSLFERLLQHDGAKPPVKFEPTAAHPTALDKAVACVQGEGCLSPLISNDSDHFPQPSRLRSGNKLAEQRLPQSFPRCSRTEVNGVLHGVSVSPLCAPRCRQRITKNLPARRFGDNERQPQLGQLHKLCPPCCV